MALIQQTVPGLYNGVSQQPPSLRLPTQCEAQDNAVGELVQGLYKRAPTKHIDTLGSKIKSYSKVHEINRSPSEHYLVFFNDDADEPIIVYDLHAQEKKTVNYGHLDSDLNFTSDNVVKEYLMDGVETQDEKTRATTVADYTIITNSTVAPKMGYSFTSEISNVAMVMVNGWYEDEVVINLNGEKHSKTGIEDYTTTEVAIAIQNLLTDSSVWVSHDCPTVIREGSILKVYYSDDREFDLNVTGVEVDVYFRTVPNYDSLWPASAFPDETVKVRVLRDTYGENVHYYLESDGKNWTETLGFNQQYELDPATMPHRLVRMSDGSFVFADINWEDQKVGDEFSSPNPSFIDQTIENVFFFQNRLGLLTKRNIILSRPGNYFDFWPTTALDLLDDDPVDIGIATSQVTTLREALPFNKNLMLRADNQQFILSYSGNLLSPKTVSVDQTTNFQTIPRSVSSSIGSNLYFACPNQEYLTVREYFVQPDSLVEDAADVTKHVPTYIPYSYAVDLAAVPQMDYLFLLSGAALNTLYVFKYYWKGNEKVQNAWCRWIFNDDIIGMAVIGPDMYIMFDVDGECVLNKIELNAEPKDEFHIDKQMSLTGSYDSGNDQTTFTLPYADPGDNWMIIDPDSYLALTNVNSPNGSTDLVVEGDYSSKSYMVGQKYNMLYELTQWYLKDSRGNANTGVLRIRSLILAYTDTGYFELVLKYKDRDNTNRMPMSGFKIGSSETGEATYLTDEQRFAVIGDNHKLRIQIQNESQLSCTFQTITYEGFYHTRAKIV